MSHEPGSNRALTGSLVLFVFASQSLQALITSIGLPAIPLVPVSSSQAVVGAVCGLALSHGLKGARQIKWSVLRNIALGWIATPAIAALISYIALYFVQNVFEQGACGLSRRDLVVLFEGSVKFADHRGAFACRHRVADRLG